MTDQHDLHLQCVGDNGERRAICRTLSYWTELKGARSMLLVADFRPEEQVPDLAPFMFLLASTADMEKPIIETCGVMIRVFCGGCDPTGMPVGKVFPYPLGENLPYLVKNVMDFAQPISSTGVCRIGIDHREAYYRTILLPLSTDGTMVDRVLGVVGCRDVAG
jgi:hypothetical protein